MSKCTDTFSFVDEAINFLKERKNENFTARQIAEVLVEKFPEQAKRKIENSTSDIVRKRGPVGQIAAEMPNRNVKERMKQAGIYISADHTYCFLPQEETDPAINVNNAEFNEKHHNNQPERELYPVLGEYCATLGIKTLRINEHKIDENCRFKGKGANKWLHPDVVGFQDITDGFNADAKQCLIKSAESRGLFYSFEVKNVLSMSTLREYFFQTVSNSSWANFSYLVSMKHDIELEEDVERELQLLCASFKIGFIELNKKDPTLSEIKIMAPFTDMDWGMVNRIAVQNTDFQRYLQYVQGEYKRQMDKDIKEPEWDNKQFFGEPELL